MCFSDKLDQLSSTKLEKKYFFAISLRVLRKSLENFKNQQKNPSQNHCNVLSSFVIATDIYFHIYANLVILTTQMFGTTGFQPGSIIKCSKLIPQVP